MSTPPPLPLRPPFGWYPECYHSAYMITFVRISPYQVRSYRLLTVLQLENKVDW